MSFNSVNTNSSSMAALQSLRTAQAATLDASKRIQTGYRVADAADDAGVFSVAQDIRATTGGWDVVGAVQARGAATAAVALEGLEIISDLVNDLQRKLTEHADSKTASTTAILAADVSAILTQIDRISQGATFDGMSPLAAPVLTYVPTTVGASAISGPQTVNGVNPFGATRTQIGGLLATQSVVQIEFSVTPFPGTVAVVYDGAVVASSNYATSAGTALNFNHNGTAPFTFEVVVYGDANTSATFETRFFNSLNPADGSVDFIRDPAGGQLELRAANATRDGLGLGALLPLPAPPTSFADQLNAVSTARALIAESSAYFANRVKTFEATREMATKTADAYKQGLGATVDADIGRDQAQVEASKAREQLALQGVSVANQSQRAVLGFLEGLGRR